jgi:hypothetical protein
VPEEDGILIRLVDEYKILQDKIDKIGAFRFTIKGWSITLVLGVIFAGTATKSVPPFIWALSLILFLAAFSFFERQQVNWGQIFGDRVLKIERVISSRLRKIDEPVTSEFIMLRFIPGIGHDLKRRPQTADKPAKQETDDSLDTQPRPSVRSRVAHHLKYADAWFYYSQALLVLALGSVLTIFPVDASRNPSVVNFNSAPQPDERHNTLPPSVEEGSSTIASPTPTPTPETPKAEPPNHGKKKT